MYTIQCRAVAVARARTGAGILASLSRSRVKMERLHNTVHCTSGQVGFVHRYAAPYCKMAVLLMIYRTCVLFVKLLGYGISVLKCINFPVWYRIFSCQEGEESG